MDIWGVGLGRNVDTGDLVINLAAGREGERQTLPNFSPQHLEIKSEDIVCLLFFQVCCAYSLSVNANTMLFALF